VVSTYGNTNLVRIAANATEFIAEAEKELAVVNKKAWLKKVDKFLAMESWDITVNNMRRLIYEALAKKQLNYTPAHYMVAEKPLHAAS
jgi:hypothetical protein